MDNETYERLRPRDILGDPPFLQENVHVAVDTIEGKPVAIHLPQTVILGRRGRRSGQGPDRVVVHHGHPVRGVRSWCAFIGAGTRIVVSTEDASYVERAKD